MTYTYRYDDVEENKRLQAILYHNILDASPKEELESLVKLISLTCNSPIAIISIIDNQGQWHKVSTGLSENELLGTENFCRHTLKQDDILEVTDARQDERMKNNPLVKAENGIRFYAGVNLKARKDFKIGTVCLVDTKPKKLNDLQKQSLKLIADQVIFLLEARKKNQELTQELDEIVNNRNRDIQRQLLHKETEYNLLLRAIKKSNAVVEFSPDGVIKSINDNFLKIVGYTREELVGNNHNILLPEDQKLKNAAFWATIRNGKFYTGKFKRRHKNGSFVWIQATYNPITDLQNNVTRVIKIARDITTEIEEEQTLKKSKEFAENLNIQKDNFIANMSHEIRTPIHAILGFTELLLEQEKETLKKSYMQAVKTAGDNLLYIINDILDLSKIEAGIIQLDKEPFDLLLTIKNIFSILHLKAHQKKISFRHQIHPEVITTLIGDKNRLTQILINLLGNAIKFTPSGSVNLYVDTLYRGDATTTLQFKIVDTGIGIPESKKDSIFDRFSQAEEDTSRNFGGTGLGLNISQQLIDIQGGSISVESKEGKGSVFTFDLPFVIGKGETINETAILEVIPAEEEKGHILLCEDNELNQRLIKAIFTEKGYTIDLAENGLKGLKLLENNEYDLILMDIQMPHMDGYEATRRIRQEMKSTVPIVALTANFLISEKAKCLQTGMNDYLAKPFTKEDILAKVSRWINGTQEKPQENIENKGRGPEVLSLGTIEELSGGNKDFQKEMMTLFIQQAEKMQDDLKEFSEIKNLEGIRSTAHKMKTSFGIIGADSELLDKIENISKKDVDSADFKDHLLKLEKQLKEIYNTLHEFLNIP